MPVLRFLLGVVLLLVVAAGGFYLWSRQPEIAATDASNRPTFDPALVAAGAQLAAIGNCNICHTVPGGAAYAGRRPIPTPFGTVYSSNITPDRDTGIGTWSEAAFSRAMREGVARDGSYLYPAFPYPHYTKLSDDDIRALYAFVMTRQAVQNRPPPNTLPFPLSIRQLVAGWNLLYLDRTPFRADPQQSAEWNRGAYLVAGLGHCGDCHTPHNFLGAEEWSKGLAGGEAEGWYAPALDAASPAPLPWEAAQVFAYLHQGWDGAHGAAAGPMAPVTRDLMHVDDREVRAIGAYIAAQQGTGAEERRRRAAQQLTLANRPQPIAYQPGNAGATIFAGACANCHAGAAAMTPPRGIDLALSTPINAADPRDAIFIILDGIKPPEGRRGPWMPRFGGTFTDQQMVALLAYLRAQYSSGSPWSDLENRVREARRSKERS